MQIVERIETQIVVKPFLIVTVAAFNFAVVPRGSRTKNMMIYVVRVAENIKRMNTFCLNRVGKFRTAVCLYYRGRITEPNNCSLHKINRGKAGMFLIRIYESLSGGFFNNGILVELLLLFGCMSSSRHIFNVQLPFDTELCGRIVLSRML